MLAECPVPTLIAEGSKIQGAIIIVSSAGIFGIVEGEIVQESLELLQVGKTGWINGAIASKGPVLIEGRVDGDITSTTKITLTATACVKGRVTAPQVEISAGAIFEGDLAMRKGVQQGKVPSPRVRKAA